MDQATRVCLENLKEQEDDFYAAVIFLVMSKLMPEMDPIKISDAVLQSYKESYPE